MCLITLNYSHLINTSSKKVHFSNKQIENSKLNCDIQHYIHRVFIDQEEHLRSLQTASAHGFRIFGELPSTNNPNFKVNSIKKQFKIASKYYESVIMVTTLPLGSTVYSAPFDCGVAVNNTLKTVGFNQNFYDALYFILIDSDSSSNSLVQSANCIQAKWITYAFMKYNAFHVSDVSSVANFHSNTMMTIREIGHILGMSSSLFGRFFPSYHSNTYLDVAKVQLTKASKTYIITPSVMAYVQRHFDCDDSQVGALIQDEGYNAYSLGCQPSVGSHWESSVYFDQVLTASNLASGARVTALTLSLFKDTGYYYSVDISKAETSYFGKGRGCSFASGEVTHGRQYCADTQNQCGFYYEYEGHCDETQSSVTSFAKPYSNRICTQPDTSIDSNDDLFAHDSRCVNFIYNSDDRRTNFCWKAQCAADNTIIYQNHNSNSDVICQIGQSTATTTVAGQKGTIICPADHQAFCGRVNCQNWCYSQGMCLNGVCLVLQCSLAIENCLSCTSDIVNRCTLCKDGYYVSGNQLQCSSCSSVISNCQLCSMNNGLICNVCMEGLFPSFDQTNCMQCQDVITGCELCKVDGITKCIQCINGYTLTQNGMTCKNNNRLLNANCTISGCSNCSIVNGAEYCDVCNVDLIPSGNNTACISPCSSAIPNCLSCSNNNTICNSCDANTFLSSTGSQCISCLSVIATCQSCIVNFTVTPTCISCLSSFNISTNIITCINTSSTCSIAGCTNCSTIIGVLPICIQCDSNSSLFPSSSLTQCLPCSTVIPNCQTCTNTNIITQCGTCQTGFTLSADQMTCNNASVCNISNCLSCSNNNTICNSCDANTFLSSTGSQCISCLSVIATCQSCIVNFTVTPTCISCLSSFNISTNIITCINTSSTCSIAGCTNCSTIIGVLPICIQCDSNSSLFPSSSLTQCLPCSTVIPNCQTCTNTNIITQCGTCQTGFTLSADQMTCNNASVCNISNCLSCSNNNTICNSCDANTFLSSTGSQCISCLSVIATCQSCIVNFTVTPTCISCLSSFNISTNIITCINTSSTCSIAGCTNCSTIIGVLPICIQCDSNSSLFPSSSLTQCLPCSTVIPNCQTCTNTNIITQCGTCQTGFTLSADQMTCNNASVCNISNCLSCSNNNTICNSCDANTFLSSTGSQCISCLSVIATCQSCIVNFTVTPTCISCLSSFNISTNIITCINTSSTCSIAGCTNCSTIIGVLPICIQCDSNSSLFPSSSLTQCLPCSTVIPNCQTCTNTNIITQCGTCQTGFTLSADQMTCNNASVCNISNCLSCSNNNTICNSCDANTFLSSTGSQCISCLSVIATCQSCIVNFTVTPTCISCLSSFNISTNIITCINTSSTCSIAGCTNCSTIIGVLPICIQCDSNSSLFPSSSLTQCLPCSTVIPNCQTCTNTNIITQCGTCQTGFTLSADQMTCNNASVCNISNCLSCSNNNTICNSCDANTFLSSTGSQCISCLSVIATCQSCIVNFTVTPTCISCLSSFNISTNIITCINTSSTCSIAGCTNCSTIIGVLPICIQCDSNSSLFPSSSLTQCLPCSTVIPNCQTCTNTNIITQCGTCQTGFTLSADQMTCNNASVCNISNCLSCSNNNTICNSCDANTFLSSTGSQCISCLSVIATCQSCIVNFTVTPTCISCLSSFNISTNIITCINTSSTCSIAGCTNCSTIIGVLPICIQCDSNSSLFPSSSLTQCLPCSTVIPNCQTCTNTNIITQCGTCQTGFTLSADQMTCNNASVCNISNCLSCSNNNTICNSCDANTFLSSTGSQCISCLSVIATCQSCIVNFTVTPTCISCLSSFNISTNIITCINTSSTCSIAGCTNCSTIIGVLPICIQCDSNSSLFPSSGLTQCLPCSTVIPNCQTCTNTNIITQCGTCQTGFTLSADQMTCNNASICNISGCTNCTIVNGSFYCYTCSNSLYLNSNFSQCLACSTIINNCNQCIFNQSTQCSICQFGFYLSSPNTCSLCSSNCSTCILSSTNCVTCIQGYYLSSNKTCLLTPLSIPSVGGTTSTADGYMLCDTGCLVCSFSSSVSTCSEALPGYTISNEKPLKCALGCKECQSSNISVCTVCSDRYVLQVNTCVACHASCATCANSTCLTCPLSYYLVSSICQKCNIANCKTCAGTLCSECNRGYSVSNNGSTCSQCMLSCSICSQTNIAQCLGCGLGFFLSSNKCAACQPGCKQCTSRTICTSCLSGYTINVSTKICSKSCAFPCLTCQMNSPSVCKSCLIDYSLSNSQCIPKQTCSSTCLSCPPTTFISASSCLPCLVSNCFDCKDNSSLCKSCSVGYFLSSNTCVKCPDNCFACFSDNECTQCNDNSTLLSQSSNSKSKQLSGKCVACQSPCLSCSGEPTICFSCVSGYKLNGWKCTLISSTTFTIKINIPVITFVGGNMTITVRTYLLSILGPSYSNMLSLFSIVDIIQGSTIIKGEVGNPSEGTMKTCQQSNALQNSVGVGSSIGGSQVLESTFEANSQSYCQPTNNTIKVILIAVLVPLLIIILLIFGIILIRKICQENTKTFNIQMINLNKVGSQVQMEQSSVEPKLIPLSEKTDN